MAQQTPPVAQKSIVGLFLNAGVELKAADKRRLMDGVGELQKTVEARVEAIYGAEFKTKRMTGSILDAFPESVQNKMTFGDLPEGPPPVFIFSTVTAGAVEAHVDNLRHEKELAQQREVATRIELKEDIRKLRSLFDNSQLESQRQANQLRDRDERHASQLRDIDERHKKSAGDSDQKIMSLGKRVGYQIQRIENLEQELSDTKNELKDTKDELRETQGTVKKLEEECDFFTYLHIRSLLDESRRIIAFAFGELKWRTFIEGRHDKELLATDIDSKFPGSALSSACIEYLCDDANPLRFHGNGVAHHKDFAKMKKAIDKVELPVEREHWHRQHLWSLYQFITTAETTS